MTVADVSPNNLIVAQSVTASGETWTVPTASAIKAAFPLTVTGTAFTFAINNLSNLDAITLAVNTGVTFGLQALNYIPQLATAVYKVTCTNAATPTFVFQLLSLSQSSVTTNNNIIVGRSTTVTNASSDCVILGNTATSAANSGVVIGPNASIVSSSSTFAVAIGKTANVHASEGVAIGLSAAVGASATAGIAISNGASATGVAALAIGNQSTGSGSHAVALGDSSSASGNQTTACGYTCVAAGTFATVYGAMAGANSSGINSSVFGYNAQSTNNNTLTLGFNSSSAGTGSVALGATAGNGASSNFSVACGYGASTTASFCTALGYLTVNSNPNSFLVGANSVSFLLSSANSTYAGVNQQAGYWTYNAANTNTSTGNYGLTVSDVAPDSLVVSNGVLIAGGLWQLPLATNMLSAYSLTTVNSAFNFYIRNESVGQITITSNTGFTLGSGTYTIPSNNTSMFRVVCTAIGGSPAFVAQKVYTSPI